MKNYLLYGLAAAILFAISASVSLWIKKKDGLGEMGDAGASKAEDAPRVKGEGDATEARALAKPDKLNTVELNQLNQTLRDREKAVSDKEAALSKNQKTLELIKLDVISERAKMDELHKQIQQELLSVSKKTLVEAAVPKLDFEKPRDPAAHEITPVQFTQPSEPLAPKNLVKEFMLDETKLPEMNALLVQQWVKDGKEALAVKALVQIADYSTTERVLIAISNKDGLLSARLKEKVRMARRAAAVLSATMPTSAPVPPTSLPTMP